jgi:Ca2+-binding EF-hand superfamily protein
MHEYTDTVVVTNCTFSVLIFVLFVTLLFTVSQDVNKNNVINYTEFLAAAIETQGIIEEYRLAEAFELLDTDNKGYISRDNLRQILGDN